MISVQLVDTKEMFWCAWDLRRRCRRVRDEAFRIDKIAGNPQAISNQNLSGNRLVWLFATQALLRELPTLLFEEASDGHRLCNDKTT
jgi:hypothetical protein